MAEPTVKRIHYRSLAERADAWMRSRLWAQVLTGLLLGVVIGFLLGPDVGLVSRSFAGTLGEWLALPGHIFLSLIKMVLMPLVASSIILGLAAGASDPAKLRRLGGGLAIFVGATTVGAATLGAFLAMTFRPGALVQASPVPVPRLKPPVPGAADAPGAAEAADPFAEMAAQAPSLIVGLVPDNPLASAVQNEMLAVVIFSIFLGVAYVASNNKAKLDPLIKVLEAMLEVSMTVVKWAMYLTPYAVFGLTAQLMARLGVNSLVALGAYVATVLAGLAALLVAYFVIAAVFGRIAPARLQRAIGDAQLLAFSTSSSAAVMPLSIETAVEKLRVPSSVASFIIPLGATVNMAGTALYQAVAVIFVAQVAGVTLGPSETAIIVITLVAASIGAPGAPGVSIAIMSGLIANFGIPAYGLVFVLGVDRFLDMARTAVNVTGDLTAARVLTRDGPELSAEEARHS
ncbi:dicarboxylate/amino acid:cation symporter [Marinicauda salina]|uniref:Dicarboxylate/amino acid:cation symporter n=1 Tax=Marinicauda salina TaxID=2135793 RepID=A0A2U2BUP8_9PROT|nr:dicarboxylate/amino acid:cation symporter [Marinicauda salina]PWE17684.1 dicarboxylate/amino acid:cation symporter [Marinicauda salina]